MKKNNLLILFTVLVVACSAPVENANLNKKKKDLEASRKELAELKQKIVILEKEIGEADPNFAKQISKAILVSTFLAEKKSFEHKVKVRGLVASRKNILINSQTAGEIQKVHVREGQQVSNGQVLVSVNADVVRHSISEIKTSLQLANSVFEKQAKLWEQKIGTELQYLQAKNNKETLENKLSTVKAQLNQAIVRAPFAGIIDELSAKEGEVAYPGAPLVRVVSQEDVYIKADVSERFIGKFKAGDMVDIYFPALDKHLSSKISSIGQVINIENRTFTVEVILPKINFIVKPNQVTILELRDYVNEATIAVPTRLVQRDNDGQFVFAVDNRENKLQARKIYVSTGSSFATQTEITEGIEGNEQIIDQGYRDVTEGVEIEIAQSGAEKGKEVAKN